MRELPAILSEMVAGGVSAAALFHEAVERVATGMVMLDRAGRVQYANTAYCQMSGYAAAELLQRSFASLEESDEDSGEAAEGHAQLTRLLRGDQETLERSGRHRRRDGSTLWVNVRASLVRDSQDAPHAVIAVVEERTPPHRRDDVLHEIQAEQLQLMEAIPQMVWVTGRDGKPEYVNERWRRFTAADPAREPFGGLGLIHAEDRERAAEIFDAALATERPYEVEYRMRRADGNYRWVLTRAQPILDAMGEVTHWFGTTMDIHEGRVAESLLLRTEKLAAAGRLAATVAHEINNPLEAVGNLIYLALHEEGLSAQSKRYLGMANEELRRVGHIVSQTLDFYRESNVSQPVELSALTNDVLSLYQRKLDARQIRVTRSMESVMVEGIAGELRQVVANLLSNAMDAMEPYGVLALEVRTELDQVRLSISDTGHGIAMPLLERIFEPFFTTKKDSGTGLGLWVSKGIVEKHRGRLDVVSSQEAADHGTAFVVTLPRRDAERRSA